MLKKIVSKPSNYIIGCALVLLGALGFSIKSILVKLAYLAAGPKLDAISLMTLRMLFALPFFLLISLWRQHRTPAQPLNTKQWSIIFILGLMGYYLASFLDFTGLHYISAGLERVILFLYPTFVVLFSAVLHRKRISAKEIMALSLSYAGLSLIFVEQLSLAAPKLFVGSVLVLGSAVTFAGFLIGSGVMVHVIGSTRFTAYTMVVASAATILHFFFLHGASVPCFSAEIYFYALLMAVFSTVLPAFFMNAGIRRIGAGAASIISTTGPIITLILAYIVLNEAITGFQLGGTLLVLAGVYSIGKV